MKFKKTITAFAASVICASAVCTVPFTGGCSSESYETRRATGYYMGTDASLVLSADFTDSAVETQANALWEEVKSYLSAIENSLSISVDGSSVNAFNDAAAGTRVQIDEICYNVLSCAVEVYNLTGGYYNPAVYYSVDLYGFASRLTDEVQPYDRKDCTSELPEEKYVSAFRTLSQGFSEIILESADGAYYVTKPDITVQVDGVTYSLKIDLGGIGKGYAADCIGALIDEYGFEYGYFNFGSSSISVKGSYGNEDGEWNLSFRDPRGDINSSYLSADVSNCSISTSGDYEQYYQIDGVRYCHIIDPTTGSPVQTGIISATIIGGTAAQNDALTTSIMAMGLENAVEFISQNLTDRKVVFVYNSGENYYVIVNDTNYFTIQSENYTFGNTVDSNGKIVLNNNVA